MKTTAYPQPASNIIIMSYLADGPVWPNARGGAERRAASHQLLCGAAEAARFLPSGTADAQGGKGPGGMPQEAGGGAQRLPAGEALQSAGSGVLLS